MNMNKANTLDDLLANKSSKQTVCFVSGNFNIIHPGHLRYLLFAAEQADFLVVGMHDIDASIGAYFDNEERLAALNALNCISAVIVIKNNLAQVLTELKPDYVVKGKEFENTENEEQDIIDAFGGKLIFSSGEKQFSSRELLSKQSNESSIIHQAIQKYHHRYNLNKDNLTLALQNVSKLKVAVFGDVIVDEYQECLAIGMSQEDPTIAVSPLESFKYLGGAGIVAAHAASLGADVDFYSVCGNDLLANFAFDKLDEYGVDSLLLRDPSRPTTHKLRYRAKDKTLLRVNNFRQQDISLDLINKLVDSFQSKVSEYDLVIFSDFSFGVACANLVNRVSNLCQKHSISVVADSQTSSQVGDLTKFKNLLLTTPTELEARQAAQDSNNGLIQVSSDLTRKLNAKNLIVTLGSEGVLIRHQGEQLETDNLPAFTETAIDTAGAGDAFLVASSLMLKSGLSIWQAAFMGNIASAVQVNIRGNVPLTKDMLLIQIEKHLK
ncbi:PfkB family carbohydrate kinase [Paraglaciecola polaris]|uniref:PfkB family carbohydrate kinase n=1 Tax=Paraglaciecola polaris TaxID=222814 RepID=UPI0030EEC866|tara:strand:- start:3007 stop:4488 length:1482 start_codon:yes stop_codon:yes gene_type:complete